MDDLGKALKEHILVLDGAVGTELMRRGGRGCLEAMVLDNEAAVRLFKAAGFDFKAVLDGWLASVEGYGGAWICQKTLNDNDTRN